MEYSDNYRGHMEAAATSGSVSALVIQLQAELHNLATHHEELVRRIRNLHKVMRGLQRMTSFPALDHLFAEPAPSPAGRKNLGASSGGSRTTAGRSGRHLQSSVRCKSNHASVSLQRACRIALMEAAQAESLEDIYARIVRRGSFAFVNFEYANPALVRVLNAMAEDGEVRLLESGPCRYWERIPRVQEAKFQAVGRRAI